MLKYAVWIVIFMIITSLGWAQSSPDEQFTFAKNLYKDGMYSLAVEQFKQFAENNPASVHADEAQFMAGECYFAEEEWKSAVAQYKAFLAGYPTSKYVTPAWFKLGESEYKRRFYEEAVAAYDHLAKRYPGSEEAPRAAFRIAECYEALENPQQAQAAYDRFLTAYPKHEKVAEALFNSGKLRVVQKDWDGAQSAFDQLIKNYPQHDLAGRALLEQANVLHLSGKLEAAKTAYAAFILKNPQSVYADDAQLGLGVTLLDMGKQTEAVTELTKVITMYVQTDLKDNAHYHLAEAWRMQKDFHQAQANYEEIIRNYPRSEFLASAEYGLALALAEEGKVYAAIEHFEKLVKAFPNTEFARSAQLRIAETNIDKGQHLNGVKAYRQYLADYDDLTDEERIDILFKIGDVLENKVQRYDMAISGYHDIALQFPQHARAGEALFAAGRCYEKLNDYAAARREYNDVLKDYANSPHYQQAKVRQKAIEDFLLKDYEPALKAIGGGLEKAVAGQSTPTDLFAMIVPFAKDLRMYPEAVRLLENFIRAYPNAPEIPAATYYAAESYHKLAQIAQFNTGQQPAQSAENIAKASAHYGAIIQSYPQSEFVDEAAAQLARYRLAELALRTPTPYAEMATVCQSFTEMYPKSPEMAWALYTLGKTLTEQVEKQGGAGDVQARQALNRLTMEYSQSDYAADGYLLLGQLSELQSDLTKADTYYQQVSDYYKGSPAAVQALFRRGLLQQRQKDFVGAIQSFEQVGREFGFHELADDALLEAGRSYVAVRNYQEAVKAFTLLKNAYPKSDFVDEADLAIGRTLRQAGLMAESTEQLQRFIAAYPNHPQIEEAYLLLAENQQQAGDGAAAVKTLQMLVEKFPSGSVKQKVADLQFDSGKYAEALAGYQASLTKDAPPDLAGRLLYQITRCHFRLDKLELATKAAKDFKKNYKDRPEEMARLDLELADYHLRQKKFDLARDTYDRVMREYPQTSAYSDAQYGLGMYHFSTGNYAASIPIFEQVARNYGGQEISRLAYFRLGTALFSEQQFEQAAVAYQRLAQQDAELKYPDAHFNLALAQEKAEKWTEAMTSYRRFTDKLPRHELAGRAYFKIGYCLFESGKYREAVDALRFSLDKVTGDDKAEAQYWLGEAYFNLGDYKTAAIELLKVPYQYPTAMEGMWAVTADFKAGVAHEKMGQFVEATRLYNKIIDKHGRDSQWGRAAKERLDAMGK